MSDFSASFEIHVHGDVPLRPDVTAEQVQEALRPLWAYTGASSLQAAAGSRFAEEPGIQFVQREHLLSMCWTVSGNEDFRYALDELCVGLNELAAAGALIEVSFFDNEFDEEDESEEAEARDDFVQLFVGPTPADIMQVQRHILVEQVTAVMEQYFEPTELDGVVEEIDRLFHQRFSNLVHSLQLSQAPSSRGGMGRSGGHKPPRRPH